MKYDSIRNLREDKDLTQEQVGYAINVPQRTYAYYEAGERMIALNALIALAIFHEVSIDYIVGLTNDSTLIKRRRRRHIPRLRIRDLREDSDFTQQFIADYLQCNQSQYSRYDRELSEIPVPMLAKLAQLYNVSIDYLVGLTDDKTPSDRSKKR